MACMISVFIAMAAVDHSIDRDLIWSIIKVESNFDPRAVGTSHGEIGLMQLRPEFHECAVFDIKKNIDCGAAYLAKVKKLRGEEYPDSWFVFYNYGPYNRNLKKPKKTDYYKKVQNALKLTEE